MLLVSNAEDGLKVVSYNLFMASNAETTAGIIHIQPVSVPSVMVRMKQTAICWCCHFAVYD